MSAGGLVVLAECIRVVGAAMVVLAVSEWLTDHEGVHGVVLGGHPGQAEHGARPLHHHLIDPHHHDDHHHHQLDVPSSYAHHILLLVLLLAAFACLPTFSAPALSRMETRPSKSPRASCCPSLLHATHRILLDT